MPLVKRKSIYLTVIFIITLSLLFVSNMTAFADDPPPTPDPAPTSDNANLSKIIINGKKLDGFNPNQLNYSYTFNKPVAKYTLEAYAEDAGATVYGTGSSEFAGAGYHSETGTHFIKVTAADNTTEKEYTITITNPPPDPSLSKNANAAMIEINGIPVPGFHPSTREYYLTMPEQDVSIKASAEDDGAKVSGTGTHFAAVGPNTYEIVVTAEDGITLQEYYIHINATDPGAEPNPEDSSSPDLEQGAGEPGTPSSLEFNVSMIESANWSHILYEYWGNGVTIGNSAVVNVVASNVSSDYTVTTTVNGGSVPSDMDYEEDYDLGKVYVNCAYYGDTNPKTFNVGTDISKAVTFPKLVISVTVKDNLTGESKTVSHTVPAKSVPSAYDAYHNHRYDELFCFEDRFLEYMQDQRIDKNSENIAENKQQIEENTEAIIKMQNEIGRLNCEVNELESKVENLRRMLFTFMDEFENNPSLEMVDFWYREKPKEVAFRFSELLFTTAHAVNNDWVHIVLDKTNYEVELELDEEKQYDIYWVANYANNEKEKEYYQIIPNSEELLVETDASSMQLPTQEQPKAAEKEVAKSTVEETETKIINEKSQQPIIVEQQGITITTLIIIVVIVLIIGGGIGIFGYLIGSKKIVLFKNRKASIDKNETREDLEL